MSSSDVAERCNCRGRLTDKSLKQIGFSLLRVRSRLEYEKNESPSH